MDERPILICYDGSEGAARSIDVAASLFAGRHAVVLHVAPVLTFAESYAGYSPAVNPTDFEQVNLQSAIEHATAGAELARRAGFDAEPRGELAGETWEGVQFVADEIDAAVIVIGSRGRKGVRERLEGSLSHQLATHAGRPVLVVPPAARPQH